MAGLPEDLKNSLTNLLLKCEEFKSHPNLQAMFRNNAQLNPFQSNLPGTEYRSLKERVDLTIAYLIDLATDGRNALVIFLHVIKDNYQDPDDRRKDLELLASRIDQCLGENKPPPPKTWMQWLFDKIKKTKWSLFWILVALFLIIVVILLIVYYQNGNIGKRISTSTITPALTMTATKDATQMETQTPTQPPTPTPDFTPIMNVTQTPSSTPLPTATQTPSSTLLPIAITDEYGTSLVLVPAGSFIMGSNNPGQPDTHPKHSVFLNTFYIDKYEVTFRQFAVFLNAKGNLTDGGVPWFDTENLNLPLRQRNGVWEVIDQSKLDYPAVEVTWYGAQAFCEWRGARLPTEAEWEMAARGSNDPPLDYPWSDSNISCNRANYKADSGYCLGYSNRVGAYVDYHGLYGTYDMAGNVWEWVADWYGEDYYFKLADNVINPTGPDIGDSRVMRGGAWNTSKFDVLTYNRFFDLPTTSFENIGFRCAHTP